jgi:transposase
VYSGQLFVFLSRRRRMVKVLAWSRGGFVLYVKRLEQGRFILPVQNGAGDAVELDSTALAMLLDGIDLSSVRRPNAWEPGRASIG